MLGGAKGAMLLNNSLPGARREIHERCDLQASAVLQPLELKTPVFETTGPADFENVNDV